MIVGKEEKARRCALPRLKIVYGFVIQCWNQRVHDILVTLEPSPHQPEQLGRMFHHFELLVSADPQFLDALVFVLFCKLVRVDVVR